MEEELNGSELGTKSYWEDVYKREIDNFEDHGDTGDVWFGEDSAQRVIKWINKSDIPKNSFIVDLGCGNGYTLTELARSGYTNLLGIDYCDEAISLAQKVSNKEYPVIKYQVFDIIKDSVASFGHKFRLVHDKGTYDAISLNPENAKINRECYINQVFNMLEDGGIFIITSCNWTQEELKKQFTEKLKLKFVIPTPQFKFGGKSGNVVTSIIFEK